MTNHQIYLFCGTCLAVSLGLAATLFPFAAVSEKTLQFSRTPQAAENIPDIDLGKDFGTVSVDQLMGYYIDNPPAPPTPGAAPVRQQQFGGC